MKVGGTTLVAQVCSYFPHNSGRDLNIYPCCGSRIQLCTEDKVVELEACYP